VAAAASVVLVIGLVMAVTGAPARPVASGSGGARVSGTAAGFPAYLADFEGKPPQTHLVVRSTSSGATVASAPAPVVRGWSLLADTLAAAPGDRTFYAVYEALHAGQSSPVEQIWIYRMNIASSGRATPLTRIKGGEIAGQAALGEGGSLAVSPDGTKLALTADTTESLSNTTPGWADKIIVIDLRTGTRSTWQGGLYRSGKTFTIPYLSWTSDGQSLVYLGLWCDLPAGSDECPGGSGAQAYRDTQVRSLRVSTGGGTLDRGAPLLTPSARYPVISGAVAGPDGSDLVVLVLSGHLSGQQWSQFAVEHVSADGGSVLGVYFHASAQDGAGQPGTSWISADPSGKYVLFSYNAPAGQVLGWVSGGTFHRLSLPGYLGWTVAW
jgi:Tol biopolymer transport system component